MTVFDGMNLFSVEVLANGVVSMRALDLAHPVPTKSRDAGAPKLFSVSLTLHFADFVDPQREYDPLLLTFWDG